MLIVSVHAALLSVGCCNVGTIAGWQGDGKPLSLAPTKSGREPMQFRVLALVVVALALVGRSASADDMHKVTIAFAGKGMSFLLQYIAIGAGFYKQEGLEPDSVDVSSGTRQAAAVMGGSAEITQVGFAHTMHAVGRGG